MDYIGQREDDLTDVIEQLKREVPGGYYIITGASMATHGSHAGAPALAVVGTDDTLVDVLSYEALFEGGATIRLFDGIGHIDLVYDQSAYQAVADWLRDNKLVADG